MSWVNTSDRTARTSAGIKAFLDRFECQVDPDGVLPRRSAQSWPNARTAYMLQLAERSAAARRRRARSQDP
jgi:hypothetical protein